MRLLSLSVKGCRCFRNQVVLSELDPRINVIYGPNESGKSTLVMSLARALFDKHTSNAQEIKDLRPWNTLLSPEISVEFETNKRYRLEKGFLGSAGSVLYEWTGSRYEAFAQGDKADDFVRNLFGAVPPSRGASRLENWGIARLLWFPQDRDRFNQPTLEGSTAERLRTLLNVMNMDPVEEKVLTKIGEYYSGIFTAKQRKYASGSEMKSLLDEKEDLEGQLRDIDSLMKQAEDDASRLEHLRKNLQNIAERKHSTRRELEELRESVEKVRELKSKLSVARETLRRIEGEFDNYHRDCETLERLKTELAQSVSSVASIKEELTGVSDALKKFSEQEKELSKKGAELRADLKKARYELEQTRNLADAKNLATEIDDLNMKIARVAELKAKRDQLVSQRETLLVASDKDFKNAREIEERIRDLESQLKAAGLSISLKAEKDLEFSVLASESSKGQMEAGKELDFFALDEAVIEIVGIATVRAHTKAGEIGKLKKELEEARGRFAEVLGRFGAGSVGELEQVRTLAKDLDGKIENLSDKIAAIAGEEADENAPAKEKARLAKKLEGLLRELEISKDALAAIEIEDEKALRKRVAELESELESTESRLDAARKEEKRAQTRESSLKIDLSAALQKRKNVLENMEALLAAYGSEDELIRRSTVAAKEIAIQREGVKDLEAQLPSEADDPERKQERLTNRLNQLEDQERKERDEIARLEQKLETVGAQGLYSRKSDLEEKLALLDERLKQERTKARAITLLKRLFEARRDKIGEMLARPIEDRITREYAAIRGHDNCQVRLSAELALSNLEIGGELGVSPEEFSAGAREQLYVTIRLAVAEILAQDTAFPVVLDDALVFTDPYRHDRMLDLIDRTADKLQIFILTSHVEKFQGLKGKYFDLIALKRGESGVA